MLACKTRFIYTRSLSQTVGKLYSTVIIYLPLISNGTVHSVTTLVGMAGGEYHIIHDFGQNMFIIIILDKN